jgi:hypothetical protein
VRYGWEPSTTLSLGRRGESAVPLRKLMMKCGVGQSRSPPRAVCLQRACRAEGSGLKKMVTPGAKREAVAHAREHHGLSERRARNLIGVSRRVVRYRWSRSDDGPLRQRLRALAAEPPVWLSTS